MWSQADCNITHLEPIAQHGWSIEDGLLQIEWDTKDPGNKGKGLT